MASRLSNLIAVVSIPGAVASTFATEPRPQPMPIAVPATLVDPDSLTFANADLQSLHRAFDERARKELEGDGWRRTPLQNEHAGSGGHWYKTIWSSPGSDPSREIRCPIRYVTLSASPGVRPEDPLRIDFVEVSAVHLSSGGWGARCDFSTRGDPKSGRTELTLYKCPRGRAPDSVIQLPGGRCGGSAVVDGLEFRFSVSTARKDGEQTLRAILDSPESFRTTALAELDILERLVRQRHEQGDLVGEFVTPAGWTSRDGKPRFHPDRPLREATEADRAACLSAAIRVVNGQRSHVRSHYKAMHAAAVSTFPLLECLDRVRGERDD